MRQEQQASSDHPEAVRSAPVPVPPPGDRPTEAGHHRDRDADGRVDLPEDVLDDRGTFDDPAVAGERDGGHGTARRGERRRDADDLDDTRPYDVRDADSDGAPEFHEPAPLPSAFGATTVGDAVAASAMASGRPADKRDPRGEDTAQPGDGAPGRTDAFDAERADPTAGDRLHDRDRWAAAEAARSREDAVVAGAAGYGRPEPGMTDPDAAAPDTALGAATARPTGGAVHGDATDLFEPDAAQAFRDRWRDVQLRFVDDPKAAAGQAQSLVEEAIKALAAALAEQKNKLGDWQQTGDDTEQLRIAVRRYRDFLDRVLGR
ncbi:hypothetical protein C5N14_23395 [Micromonospora sp. MW-13]|uniref:hypothetical protein n=1 Tax=Micromonospora sp. MW-13 TaxID=2094022 RepID=UPI000E42E7B5|nr:hypothetical protein [Micromonospora sp. MW-13]RGC66344.1 hypothetical protein C5N14_23395 [Micromonospora sp. MW-13]